MLIARSATRKSDIPVHKAMNTGTRRYKIIYSDFNYQYA